MEEKSYLYYRDTDFLTLLTKLPIKDFYAKIIVLDWSEKPIQQIESEIINGNFTIDGKSSIRRTGNLSAIVRSNTKQEITTLFSLNKKVKIEVGFLNTTSKYIDHSIIWFPLGIYVITGCSVQNSLQGLTLSIQLKDKMCLLNGECGGVIPAGTVFDHMDTIDDLGQWIIKRPTIYHIIQLLVHHFGNEQLGKIIISDLDTIVKQVVKWSGKDPLYIYSYFDPSVPVLKRTAFNKTTVITTSEQSQYDITESEDKIAVESHKFKAGQDVGYIYTDFSYPGDLVCDAGNSVVDVLEKIKNTLGNYEYFYDIFGNFIFQLIKNYLNNSQTLYILRQMESSNTKTFVPDFIASGKIANLAPLDVYLSNHSLGKSVFNFNDSTMINSYTYTPQYNMVKNDFVVWGIKKTSLNDNIPIRYHLVFDKKPNIKDSNGKNYKYLVFKSKDPVTQMLQWYKPVIFKTLEEMLSTLGILNNYYYCKDTKKLYIYTYDKKYLYKELKDVKLQNIEIKDWRTYLYFEGVFAESNGLQSNYYYTELKTEWPKIYDIENATFKEEFLEDPSSLTYYLDFIDSSSSFLSQFNVDVIGRRSQVWNNDKINCVFESDIPDIVFSNLGADREEIFRMKLYTKARGQTYYQLLSSIYNNMTIGGTQESAYDMIKQILHQYSSYNESIQLQTLPIYFLLPNTRITVNDINSNIFGDYMINSMSFSFDSSSFLTITATKALEKI